MAILRLLVEKKARVDCRAKDLQQFDVIPGLTPLHFAAKHSCDCGAIIELLQLKASVNETDALGTSALGHAGSSDVVQLLLLSSASVTQRRPPFGMPVLSACILRPLEPKGLELLITAKALVNDGRGMYALSPLSTACLFPGMPYAFETIQLLLEAEADVSLGRSMKRVSCLSTHRRSHKDLSCTSRARLHLVFEGRQAISEHKRVSKRFPAQHVDAFRA